MSRILGTSCVVALAIALACASNPTTSVSPPPANTWIQVWSDEFDGPAGARFDEANWGYDIGDGCQDGNCGWGNKEKEYYTNSPNNISLNGQGQLMIVARIAPAGLHCYYGPCLYTSGKITTRGKVLAAPGRVEARIRLAQGQGLWPAFWMLGYGTPGTPWPASGELDIMENKGSQSTTTSSALHGPGYSGDTPFAHAQNFSSGTISDFHTYAVEWDSAHVRFFVDNIAHYGITRGAVAKYGQWVLDQPFYVILNLAVGGHFDGDPRSDAIFPATMLVDYVRVFRAQPKSP
jgi:beta-glucanase (GH16 family)